MHDRAHFLVWIYVWTQRQRSWFLKESIFWAECFVDITLHWLVREKMHSDIIAQWCKELINLFFFSVIEPNCPNELVHGNELDFASLFTSLKRLGFRGTLITLQDQLKANAEPDYNWNVEQEIALAAAVANQLVM